MSIRCPSLGDLPDPLVGKAGWPWTQESPHLPDAMPDGAAWPRLTIVTPSYNQGQFIEETLRSVLLQGYPNLEHIVMDGGSTDSSVATIHKYSRWITYWVSQPDGGQADALAQGFSRATGSLLGWLNSDDIYLPGALAAVAQAHHHTPHALVAGSVINSDGVAARDQVVRQRNLTLKAFLRPWERSYSWHQPGVFFPRAAYEAAGGLDGCLRYAMDMDLMCRLLQLDPSVAYVDQPLARFRLHATSKTLAENTGMALESYAAVAAYWHLLGGPRAYYACRMLLHLSQRSLKCAVRGAPRDACDSLLGGLRLFAAVLTDRPA